MGITTVQSVSRGQDLSCRCVFDKFVLGVWSDTERERAVAMCGGMQEKGGGARAGGRTFMAFSDLSQSMSAGEEAIAMCAGGDFGGTVVRTRVARVGVSVTLRVRRAFCWHSRDIRGRLRGTPAFLRNGRLASVCRPTVPAPCRQFPRVRTTEHIPR